VPASLNGEQEKRCLVGNDPHVAQVRYVDFIQASFRFVVELHTYRTLKCMILSDCLINWRKVAPWSPFCEEANATCAKKSDDGKIDSEKQE
jgi:hypothetical protein